MRERLEEARTSAGLQRPSNGSSTLELLDEILLAPEPTRGLETLLDNGGLEAALPEVHAIVGFHESCPVHHKDLWAHTLEVLERTRADVDLRWAVLMHDSGKPETRAISPSGRVTFHRHEDRGAVLMRQVGARLQMSPERLDRIAFVIERHGWVNAYRPQWTDRAVRRLMRESGSFLGDLLDFSRWDYTTRRRARQRRIVATLEHLDERIERLRREDEETVSFPRGLGSALAAALDLVPGPELGQKIEQLRAQARAGELSRDASLEELVEAAREVV